MSGVRPAGGAVGPPGPAGPAGADGGQGGGSGPGVNGLMSCAGDGGAGAGGSALSGSGGSTLDGWVAQSNTNMVQFSRESPAPSGAGAAEAQLLQNSALGAEKLLLAQFWPARDSATMALQNILAGMQYQATDGVGGPEDVKIGFFFTTGGANPNELPRPIVTAFNADGVNPTFAANINTILIGGPVASNAAAMLLLVFTTGFPALPSPGTDMFGMMVWTDNAVPTGGDLRLSNVSVQPTGTFVRPNQANSELQKSICKQQVESTYPDGQDPGGLGPFGGEISLSGGIPNSVPYEVEKIFDPTAGPGLNPDNGLTIFSPVTGAAGMVHDLTAGADVGFVLGATSTKGFTITPTAPGGNNIIMDYVANAAI